MAQYFEDKTGEKVLREGMPELLDIYDNYNIKSTFFYTYYIANKFPDIVKIAAEADMKLLHTANLI